MKLGKKYLAVWSYVLWSGKSFPNLSFIVLRPHSRSARAGLDRHPLWRRGYKGHANVYRCLRCRLNECVRVGTSRRTPLAAAALPAPRGSRRGGRPSSRRRRRARRPARACGREARPLRGRCRRNGRHDRDRCGGRDIRARRACRLPGVSRHTSLVHSAVAME